MPLADWDQLFEDADRRRPLLPVAVAGGADRTALEALRAAHDRGWVRPVVARPEADVRRPAAQAGLGLHGLTLGDADGAAAAGVAEERPRRGGPAIEGRAGH